MANLSQGSRKHDMEWAMAKKVIGRLPVDVKEGGLIGSNKFANRFLKAIKKAVKSGGAGFSIAPLKPRTLEIRKRYGVDSALPFNFWGIYLSSIQKRTTSKGEVLVGFKKGVRHPGLQGTGKGGKGKLTIANIANILEKGSKRMQARPLWKKVYEDLGGNQAAVKQVRASIRTLYKNRYGIRLR